MLFEALVLNCNCRLFHFFRHLAETGPDAVFGAVQPRYLHRLLIFIVSVYDGRLILVRLVFIQVNRRIAMGEYNHIDKHRHADDQARQRNRYQRAQKHFDRSGKFTSRFFAAGFAGTGGLPFANGRL